MHSGPTPPQKIMFCLPTLGGGGAERVTVTLLRHLDRKKFLPILLTVSRGDEALRGSVSTDIPVKCLSKDRIRDAIWPLRQLIRQEQPDLVFSTLNELNLALCGLKAAGQLAAPLVLRLPIALSGQRRTNRLLLRAGFSQADAVVFQSDAMRDEYLLSFNDTIQRPEVIRNPVDIDAIRQMAAMERSRLLPKERFNLVVAARLVHNKGIDTALRAISELRMETIHLTVLGVGPLTDSLRTLARQLGVESQVSFLGFASNPYPYIAQADAFLLSSRVEGFPNVILEALACGTPVVTTPVLGLSDAFGNSNCITLAERFDHLALAAALRVRIAAPRALPEPVLLARYAAPEVAKSYQNLFDELIQKRRRRSHATVRAPAPMTFF